MDVYVSETAPFLLEFKSGGGEAASTSNKWSVGLVSSARNGI